MSSGVLRALLADNTGRGLKFQISESGGIINLCTEYKSTDHSSTAHLFSHMQQVGFFVIQLL